MIFVAEARLREGRWQVHLPDRVDGPDDLDHVPSLDGYEAQLQAVRVEGEERDLTVYRKGPLAWVRLDELDAFDLESIEG